MMAQDKKAGKKTDRVSESHATYRLLSRVKDRKAMRAAARRMDQFLERHAKDKADKDVVTLVREERER
jgi:hypothetical protein